MTEIPRTTVVRLPSAATSRQLVAGIRADNRPAQSFYGTAGYRDQALVMVRDLEEG